MAIDPKNYRQCWSCKYCEDVGTHTYEDYVTYMRQCSHSRLDVIDKVPLHCEHYVWDGTTREFWRESASASSYRNSSSSGSGPSGSTSGSESDGSFLLGILVIVGALVLIGIVISLFNRATEPKEAQLPENIQSISGISTEEPTEDIADYSLSGAIRYVSTQSGNGVNMRSRPDANADIVSGIPEYQSVTIRKTIGNWAYVSFDGIEGWCNMDYLITEEEHFQRMQEYLNIPAIVATETSPLRLRSTPSLDSEILESMPRGSEVIVLRLEGDWAYVEYRGMSGWCSVEYLDFQD